MIIDTKEVRVAKRGKKTKFYLIRCESCGNESWYEGKLCKRGKRKYCSRACINSGRLHSANWKDNMSLRNSGVGNPFYGHKHSAESRKQMSESHEGLPSYFDIKKRDLSAEEYDEWYDNYCQSRRGAGNPFYGKKHTAETRLKISNTRAKLISEGKIDLYPSHYGIKGYYKSTKMREVFRHDSLIELLRMRMLDRDINVVSWTKKHSIRITYILDGQYKKYVPDFLIQLKNGDKILEEVKGYENQRKKEAKFDVLRMYCSENKLICSILTYDDIDRLCKMWFGKRINVLRKEYHKEKANKNNGKEK